MSLFAGYQANKAIAKIIADQSMKTGDSKQALIKLKKMGPAAVPNLIEALAATETTTLIENLLLNFLDTKTLPLYTDALARQDQRIVAAITRILSASDRFDPNPLVHLFDQQDIPRDAITSILLAHKNKINPTPLIASLDKVSASIRPHLYRLLEQLVTAEAVPSLIEKNQCAEPMVRAYLASLLAKFDLPIVHHSLVLMLTDSNKNVRLAALRSLARLKSTDSAEAVCKVLRDPDLTVQTAAIETLVVINAPGIVKFLIEILQDESEYVRRAAVAVLNEVGDHHAIKDLLDALRDADWWVKVRAADALGSIGGPKVFEAVLTLIRDEDEFMRRTAVEILNTSKDVRAFDRLVEALNDDDWWVRERAVDALAAIGDKRAVQPLIEMLDKSPGANQIIIRALATLGDERAINPLIRQISQQDTNARKDALQALRSLAENNHAQAVNDAVTEIINRPDIEITHSDMAAMKTLIIRHEQDQTDNHRDTEPDLEFSPASNSTQIARPTSQQGSNIELIDAARLVTNDVVFERYKVIRQIGKGAFGVVVLVEDMIVNDQFILKFLAPHMAMDENIIRRFTQELRYARKITHQNVIRIYDFITRDKTYAISMEYFYSHSLAFELKDKKPLDIQRGIGILCEVCKGLEAAQAAGVVHRDIKPGNILINENNEVKIVDFGLAAAASHTDSRLTKTGILVGTPTYMAPEQVRGKAIDSRTDVYSLAIIMYEMFTGKAPYISDESLGIMFQHVEGNAKPPREINADIPPELQTIIQKAMSIKPEDRYQSFSEFRQQLESLITENV